MNTVRNKSKIGLSRVMGYVCVFAIGFGFRFRECIN